MREAMKMSIERAALLSLMTFATPSLCSLVSHAAYAADQSSAKPQNVVVEVLDKTRRKNAYDGLEITSSKVTIKVPMGKPDWAFSLSDFENNKLSKLKIHLGESNFLNLVKTQGYVLPKTEFEAFRGEDRLPVYYFTRPDKASGSMTLILVSYGEYQPSRYIAHIEGIWRIKGMTF